ncbi:MAG: glycosyltransferase family 39 protein [Herpetosiphon sp.]
MVITTTLQRWWSRRTDAGWLFGPGWLLLPLLLTLVGGVLVYQLPVQSGLGIGALGDQAVLRSSQSQDGAGTELGMWYPDEQDRGQRYRWTRSQARLVLRDFGGGKGRLVIRAAGWPEEARGQRQPTVVVAQDGREVGSFVATPRYQEWSFDLPPSSDATRVLTLRTSTVLTTTVGSADPRPKGLRVNHIVVAGSGGAGQPVGWRTVGTIAVLGTIGALGVARRSSRRWLATLLGCGIVVACLTALARARIAAVAGLPIALGALAALLILAEWRTLARFGHRWRVRWARSLAAETGLLVVLPVIGVLLALFGAQRLPLPSLRAVRDDVEWLVALGPAALAVVLVLLAGPTKIPRWLQRVRRQLIIGRLAMWLLGGFLVLWIGWEAVVLWQVPLVGHADYADNAVVARSLLRGRGWEVPYVTQFYNLRPSGNVYQPQPTWPLLQPVWMAPFMALLGPTAFAARLPNLVFNAALALVIFWIGAHVWDRRVGLLAAMLTLVNQLFFKLAVFATTDLAFVVWCTAALALVFVAAEGVDEGRTVRVTGKRLLDPRLRFAVAGLVTGLMILQKPSAALLALGMLGWLLLVRRPGSRVPLIGIAQWLLVAGVVVLPYIVRNYLVFGKPFSSTESYDAWILFYEGPTKDAWRKIYSVYVGDTPNHSWLLRWGWDRIFAKWATQARAGWRYLLPTADEPGLIGRTLTAFAVVGVLTLRQRQRRLLLLVLFAAAVYVPFLIVYWHLRDEKRYLLPFVPWLLLLTAGAVCTLFDRIGTVQQGRWLGLAGLLLSIALVAGIVPDVQEMDHYLDPQNAGYWGKQWQPSLRAFDWLAKHTERGAVVMSQVPWQLAFYADRPGVMVPNEPLPTILGVAKHYHAQYLLVNSTAGFGTEASDALRQLIAPPGQLQPGQQVGGWRLVHQEPSPDGRKPVLIYQMPEQYAGAGPIVP